MVASLAHPGGNATGLSVQSTELAGKRIELLREVLPNLRRLAIIADVGYSGSVLEAAEVQATASKVGLDVDVLVPALKRLKKRFRLGIISNIDDDLFASTAKWLEVPFDYVITAEQVRSYKPSVRALIKKRMQEILEGVAQSAGGTAELDYRARQALAE